MRDSQMHSVCLGLSSSSSSETNLSENCLHVIGERCFKIYNFDGTVKRAADVNPKRQKRRNKKKRRERERKVVKTNQNTTEIRVYRNK